MPKKDDPQHEILNSIAQCINSSNSELIRPLLTDTTYLNGDIERSNNQGVDTVLTYFDELQAALSMSNLPCYAELANYRDEEGDDYPGILIVLDDDPYLYLMAKPDENGCIESVYVSRGSPNPKAAEGNGKMPGLDVSRYEVRKASLLSERKRLVSNLGLHIRPHFVGVVEEDQDPTTLMLALEELNRSFEGSSIELHVYRYNPIKHTDNSGNVIRMPSAAEEALDQMGGKGFPCIGVMLGPYCLRPAYKNWCPDTIIEDLIQVGVEPRIPEKFEMLQAS